MHEIQHNIYCYFSTISIKCNIFYIKIFSITTLEISPFIQDPKQEFHQLNTNITVYIHIKIRKTCNEVNNVNLHQESETAVRFVTVNTLFGN